MEYSKIDEIFSRLMDMDQEHKEQLLVRLYGLLELNEKEFTRKRMLEVVQSQVERFENKK